MLSLSCQAEFLLRWINFSPLIYKIKLLILLYIKNKIKTCRKKFKTRSWSVSHSCYVFLQQLTITKQYLFLKNNLKVTACFFFFLSQAESEINMISTLQARYRARVFCLVFPYVLASRVDTAYYIILKICAYVVTNLGSRKIFLAVY